jgi:hypothetical protein
MKKTVGVVFFFFKWLDTKIYGYVERVVLMLRTGTRI